MNNYNSVCENGIDSRVHSIKIVVRGESFDFNACDVEKFSLNSEKTIKVKLKDQRMYVFFYSAIDYIEYFPKCLV